MTVLCFCFLWCLIEVKHVLAKKSVNDLIFQFLDILLKEHPKGEDVGFLSHDQFTICNLERLSFRREPERATHALRERLQELDPRKLSQLTPVILKDLRTASEQAELMRYWANLSWITDNFGKFAVRPAPPCTMSLEPGMPWHTFEEHVKHVRAELVDPASAKTALQFQYMFKNGIRMSLSKHISTGSQGTLAFDVPKQVGESLKHVHLSAKDSKGVEFVQVQSDNTEFLIQQKFLGLPFHSHAAITNEVVSGRKHWMFFPPMLDCLEHKSIDTCNEIHRRLVQILHNFSFLESPKGSIYNTVTTCRSANNCSELNDTRCRLSLHWIRDTLPRLPLKFLPYRCTVHPGEMLAAMDRIHQDVMQSFTNFSNGMVILKQASRSHTARALWTCTDVQFHIHRW